MDVGRPSAQQPGTAGFRPHSGVYRVLVGRVGDGSADVTVAGRTIRVDAGGLEPGQWYSSRIVRTSQGWLLVDPRRLGAPGSQASLGSPAKAFASAHTAAASATGGTLPLVEGLQGERGALDQLVKAFVRTGLPLLSHTLQYALRRVSGESRLSPAERSRLAALLADKGLLESDAVWESLVTALSHDSAGDRHGSRSGHDDRREDEGLDSDLEHDRVIAADEVRYPFCATAHSGDPIQLFNHTYGRGDHWMVIPFSFSGQPELRASLRMRVPRHAALAGAGSIEFTDAILRADTRATAIESYSTFALHRDQSGLRASLVERSSDSRSLDELIERLELLGVQWDDSDRSAWVCDGFSTWPDGTIIPGVDESA